MNKKNVSLIVLLVVSFFLVSSQVLGATNIIDSILMPFKGVDFGRIYDSYYSLIDFVIYLLLFIGMAQIGLNKMPWGKERSGKSMMIVLGVALAFGAITFARKVGFRIGDLGSIAALLFFVFLAFLIFRGLHQVGTSARLAGAVAFLLIYGLLILNNKLFSQITKNIYANLLLSAGFIVALIIIFIEIGRLFKGRGVGGIQPSATTSSMPTERPKEPPKTGREDTAVHELINEEVKNLEELDKHIREVGNEINLLKESYNQKDVPRMTEINRSIRSSSLKKLIEEIVKRTRRAERYKRRISNRTGGRVDKAIKNYESLVKGRQKYFSGQKGKENIMALLADVEKDIKEFEVYHDNNIQRDSGLILKIDRLRIRLKEAVNNYKHMIKYTDGIEKDLTKAAASGLGPVASSLYNHLSGLIRSFNTLSNLSVQYTSQLREIEKDSMESLNIERSENAKLTEIFNKMSRATSIGLR